MFLAHSYPRPPLPPVMMTVFFSIGSPSCCVIIEVDRVPLSASSIYGVHSVLSENESSQPAVRRVRVDRERNRAAIVAAARAAFARADAAGIPLSMNEVARAANVGVATL